MDGVVRRLVACKLVDVADVNVREDDVVVVVVDGLEGTCSLCCAAPHPGILRLLLEIPKHPQRDRCEYAAFVRDDRDEDRKVTRDANNDKDCEDDADTFVPRMRKADRTVVMAIGGRSV